MQPPYPALCCHPTALGTMRICAYRSQTIHVGKACHNKLLSLTPLLWHDVQTQPLAAFSQIW
jgi:hypothetical protein